MVQHAVKPDMAWQGRGRSVKSPQFQDGEQLYQLGYLHVSQCHLVTGDSEGMGCPCSDKFYAQQPLLRCLTQRRIVNLNDCSPKWVE